MDKNRMIISLFEGLDRSLDELDIVQYSVPEQVVIMIFWLELEVNNGGFDQFYFNSAGVFANRCPQALRTIGAFRTALIVERANSYFPNGHPPEDREQRQCCLEEIVDNQGKDFDELDDQFYAYEDNLTDLLYDYIVRHKSSIAGATELGF